jgi:putative aldouronate transport system substrate-binding protein
MRGESISRRTMLQRGALAGMAVALSACSAPAPQAPRAASGTPPGAPAVASGAATGTTFGGVQLPTYVSSTQGPKPDVPSTGPNISGGFLSYPANPPRATQTTPGRGSEVTFFVPAYYPPATPLEQNSAWQEVNKQLGATIKFEIVPLGEAGLKLAALMAGNDLPDLMHFSLGWDAAPNLPQFAEAKCADLTPYLSGDAIKAYPNLAAIPTYAWRSCVYKGRLYAVPIHRPAVLNVAFANSAVYDREFGGGYVPKSADDFKRMLTQVTRPQSNQWGYGAFVSATAGSAFDIVVNYGLFTRLFRAPNQWRLESGQLTNTRETAEFRAAVGYVRDLWSSGVFYPESASFNGVIPAQEAFWGSKFVFMSHTMAYYAELWRRGLTMNPAVVPRVLPLFSNDGSPGMYHLSRQVLSTTALKKASPDRIKELLGIVNWLAAPFGSQEDRLIYYGISGVDYALDDRGNPKPTEQGTRDANYVPWRYVAQRPWVLYDAGLPDFASVLQRTEQSFAPGGIQDPMDGLYSPTNSSLANKLAQPFTDGVAEVVRGTRPLGDLDALVSEWRTNGGDKIRAEYQEALDAAG